VDLEDQVKILKKQIISVMDQAEKSNALSQKVSSLEDQLSALMAKILQLEDGDLYITKINEAASEQLVCKLLRAPEYSCQYSFCPCLTICI
jgi:hypothetical protein